MPRVALISDTHLPERLSGLPPAIFDHLSGCDLVLHAGDVGTMDVLDDLARIAPVVAVRGNDGWTDSANLLPLEQIVVVAGVRILLWHGHFEDRSDELAWRRAAQWPDIVDRIHRRARAREATVVVTGHTHIPAAHEHDGVLLVNPGAIAPGNAFMAQTLRTVAVLDVPADGRHPSVEHVDIDRGTTIDVGFDLSEPFDTVSQRFQRILLDDRVRPFKRDLDRLYRMDPAFRSAWLGIAHRVWAGAQNVISFADMHTALAAGSAEARAFAERAEPAQSGAATHSATSPHG